MFPLRKLMSLPDYGFVHTITFNADETPPRRERFSSVIRTTILAGAFLLFVMWIALPAIFTYTEIYPGPNKIYIRSSEGKIELAEVVCTNCCSTCTDKIYNYYKIKIIINVYIKEVNTNIIINDIIRGSVSEDTLKAEIRAYYKIGKNITVFYNINNINPEKISTSIDVPLERNFIDFIIICTLWLPIWCCIGILLPSASVLTLYVIYKSVRIAATVGTTNGGTANPELLTE